MTTTDETRAVAQRWFQALASGDVPTITACLDPDVEFINYTVVPGYNDDMAWIGTHRGAAAALASFGVFLNTCEVLSESLVQLVCEGDTAIGVVHEISRVRANGQVFEIEFVQRLTIANGRIVRWKSYTDPSPIVRALRGGAVAAA